MDLRERRSASTARHPWERARLAFVDDLVRVHAVDGDVVDIGAGDGFVAAWFHAAGRRVFAVDAHYTDTDLATMRAALLNPSRTPPAHVQAAVVLLLDVIEHVDDDVDLLRTARDLLTETGVAVITVPAWPALFSRHDRALHHHRRYTPAMLHTAIQHAGLRVVVDGGLFHGLLLPRALSVLAERLRGSTDADDDITDGVGSFSAPAVVGDAITRVLRLEQRLSLEAARRGIVVPGLSHFAVVRR